MPHLILLEVIVPVEPAGVRVDALAIDNGRIAAIGPRAEMLARRTPPPGVIWGGRAGPRAAA